MFASVKLWQTTFMNQTLDLNQLSPEQLKTLASQLLGKVQTLEHTNQRLTQESQHYQFINEKLAHELAILNDTASPKPVKY